MPDDLRLRATQQPRRYMTRAEVAKIVFGVTVDRFYHMTPALKRRGFPSPVKSCGYDPLAITAWQDMEVLGCFAATAAKATADNIVVLDDAALERAALERV